jgi:transforming growth factor-beta-induced protein
MKKWFIPLLGIIALVVAACQQPAPSPDPEPQTIADVAQGNEDLSILVEALVAAELVATLEGEGPFTVFAPTNAAFEALLEAQGVADLDGLIAELGVEAVTNILLYHVVTGDFSAADLIAQGEGSLPTALEGNTLAFAVVDGSVVINDSATVVEADIEASNGVIHVIDTVLMPEDAQNIVDIAQETEELSILVEALVAAELVATLEGEGPFTVFAPTNAAFEALLEAQGVADLDALIAALGAEVVTDILLYHVVVGVELDAETVIATAPNLLGSSEDAPPIYYDVVDGNVVLNGSATVTTADIEASNGIIHIIDAVILPPTAVVELTLSGDQEVPPVETDATGSATVGLFGNNTLFVKGTFSGFEIGGPGAHIHGPAPAGENAGILFDLTFDNDTNSFSGIFALDDEQVGFFNDGLLYINLHSEANPAGEIRGQIVP